MRYSEGKLVFHDVVGYMSDYTSLQPDIDEDKLKSALLVAQTLEVKPRIGAEALERCVNPASEADEALRELLIPPLCYYTYHRCLTMFQGVLTDGGFATDAEATSLEAAKSVANQMYSIGECFMEEVIAFLEEESPNEGIEDTRKAPQIRVFGGEENRASN